MGFSTESCVIQVGCESVLFSVSGESRAGPGPPLTCFAQQLHRPPYSLSLHKVSCDSWGGRTAVGFASSHPTDASPSSPSPRHITVKPRVTQTPSLPVGAVKGTEEELGNNREMLGKCCRTNVAFIVL